MLRAPCWRDRAPFEAAFDALIQKIASRTLIGLVIWIDDNDKLVCRGRPAVNLDSLAADEGGSAGSGHSCTDSTRGLLTSCQLRIIAKTHLRPFSNSCLSFPFESCLPA